MTLDLPTFADVHAAAVRIKAHARRTPVLNDPLLDAEFGARLYFKCENLQHGGAFKFRGAINAVFALDAATAARGVVTQSSGNHGTAIALAAARRGVSAHVVVPRNAPAIKLAQIRAAGANVVLCEPSMGARDAACAQLLARTGGSLVHPFDNAMVIAGQGTAALELLAEVPDLDALIAPVSGGGLLSGSLLAARGLNPRMAVFGAEPEQAADAFESLRQGRRITDMTPDTICDGLRAHLGERAFAILHPAQVPILLASEAAIVAHMRRIWERLKLVIEPSCAVPLAALANERARFAGQRIGIIISGGNVDLDHLPWQTLTSR